LTGTHDAPGTAPKGQNLSCSDFLHPVKFRHDLPVGATGVTTLDTASAAALPKPLDGAVSLDGSVAKLEGHEIGPGFNHGAACPEACRSLRPTPAPACCMSGQA
jgi:hypothetical protein